MDIDSVLLALHALDNRSRMGIFRLLARRAPEVIPVEEIAEELGILRNAATQHLGVLARAGLVVGRRQAGTAVYRADTVAFRGLINFLDAI